MSQALWYCPLCQSETAEPDAVFCRNDGARVRSVDARGADWIGKVLAEKYKVTRYIDAGGTAEVYEAERTQTGKRVAVKFLHAALATQKDMMDNFLQEAQLVSLIAHPNIVEILDFGTLPGAVHYMVMELLDGIPLSTEISRGPLPVIDALKYAMQACEGLAAAHARDVIHCDIKPGNIFLQRSADGGEPTVKILDLGIGRLFASGQPVGLDAPGIIAGTPEYMSPEQAQGQPLGPASDIYSMGIAIYEMLFGEVPFADASYIKVLRSHIHDPPPWPQRVADARNLAPGTRDVLWRALAKEPKARQGSMLELQRELGTLSRHEKGMATLARSRSMQAPSMPSSSMTSDAPRISKSMGAPSYEPTFTAEEDGSGRWRSPPVPRRPSSKRALGNVVALSAATGSDTEVVELTPDVYWVGRRAGRTLECNSFLRVYKRGGVDVSVLVDPGPPKDLDVVIAKVSAIIGSLKRLDYVFLSSPDADAASNVATILQSAPRAQVLCSEDMVHVAQLYGLDPKHVTAIECLAGGRMKLATEHELVFVPTPFCPVRGASMLFDPASRVLFSGGLFGGVHASALAPSERSMAGVEIFHQITMPTRRALATAVERVRRLDPQPIVLAPHHGAVVGGDGIEKMLDAIEKLDVGLDLLESTDEDSRFVDAANDLVGELADAVGKDRARALHTIFAEDNSFIRLVVFGDDGEVASFKVTPRLGLEALASDALAALPAERRGDLQRSIRAIWKQHGIERQG